MKIRFFNRKLLMTKVSEEKRTIWTGIGFLFIMSLDYWLCGNNGDRLRWWTRMTYYISSCILSVGTSFGTSWGK